MRSVVLYRRLTSDRVAAILGIDAAVARRRLEALLAKRILRSPVDTPQEGEAEMAPVLLQFAVEMLRARRLLY